MGIASGSGQAARVMAQLFVLFVMLVATACGEAGSKPAPTTVLATLPECTWADLVRVTDGDTIVVRIGGVEERVRYIGVDTPEMANFGDPDEPFAAEAKARNAELLEEKRVCLERDISDRDQFARLLRYAWLADGRLINEVLLREGLAVVSTFPPDVKYVESRYLPAQRAAREEGLGLWE